MSCHYSGIASVNDTKFFQLIQLHAYGAFRQQRVPLNRANGRESCRTIRASMIGKGKQN
jgi:hypothetical protein